MPLPTSRTQHYFRHQERVDSSCFNRDRRVRISEDAGEVMIWAKRTLEKYGSGFTTLAEHAGLKFQ